MTQFADEEWLQGEIGRRGAHAPSAWTLARWVKKGVLPPRISLGGRKYWLVSDLEQFFADLAEPGRKVPIERSSNHPATATQDVA